MDIFKRQVSGRTQLWLNCDLILVLLIKHELVALALT